MGFTEFKKQYGIQANEQQEKAIQQIEGPALLLAVPGSGKTTVIVSRTGYMIYEKHIHPENILTVTFTTAAAKEMEERFVKKFQYSGVMPHFSTIHSMCVSILNLCRKRHGAYVPALEPNNARVVREVLVNLMTEYPDDAIIAQMAQAIGFFKNNMYTEEKIIAASADNPLAVDTYRAYIAYMDEHGLMDFDDQLLYAYKYLREYPDVLDLLQEKYRYISVDEAQDTSFVQHMIIRLLASKYQNIFMVGDEDQCIYGFRGAYPQALLEFSDIYPNAVQLYMETNYRSTQEIVSSANKFIKRNHNRYQKNMVTVNDKGCKISEKKLDYLEGQYRYILSLVKTMPKDETLAVLFRNNNSAIPLIDLFDREGIQFNCRDSSELFFSNFLTLDIVGLLKLALNPRDFESYTRLYYKLNLFLSKSHLSGVEEVLSKNSEDSILEIVGNDIAYERIEKKVRLLAAQLKTASKLPPADAISLLVKKTGYNEYLTEKTASDIEESGNAIFNTLCTLAREYKTIPEFLEGLVRLKNAKHKRYGFPITLATMHSSKGLEFDTVIVIDALQGIIPSNSALMNQKDGDDTDIENDVRLFYVAVTRAKKRLLFINANKWMNKKVETSVFVTDMLPKPDLKVALNWKGNCIKPSKPVLLTEEVKVGTRLIHKSFGSGMVMSRNDDIVTVNFKGNIKTISLSFSLENNIIRVN